MPDIKPDHHLSALSLTPAGAGWLSSTTHPHILHVFDSVCNLINERREVLSIVTPQIGNGPFNLVVEDGTDFSEHLNLKSLVSISSSQLKLRNVHVQYDNTQLWNPCPDWTMLETRREQILDLIMKLPIADHPLLECEASKALLPAIVTADSQVSCSAAKQLAGLGIGLTPSGDDFLMGAMYAAWVIHSTEIARPLTLAIAEVSAPLTTSLSAAWLKAAAIGEAGTLWHELFNAMIAGTDIHLQIANLFSVGETSGADALAGFAGTLISYEVRETKPCLF